MMNPPILPQPGATALLVIDIQERLLPAMDAAVAESVLRQTATLIEVAREFGWQVIYTEQYPKGLGATSPRLAEPLESVGAIRAEKVEFSCLRNETFAREILPKLKPNVVIAGMETHICVLQTVADLQARGHQVYLAADATCSRTAANHANGLAQIERLGAVVTNTESLLFGACEKAGTDSFKRLSKLVR